MHRKERRTHQLTCAGTRCASRQTDLNACLCSPDYVQCDYCGRRFNQTAAERHIPFCREKNARIGGPPVRAGHSQAAEKQAKRTQVRGGAGQGGLGWGQEGLCEVGWGRARKGSMGQGGGGKGSVGQGRAGKGSVGWGVAGEERCGVGRGPGRGWGGAVLVGGAT